MNFQEIKEMLLIDGRDDVCFGWEDPRRATTVQLLRLDHNETVWCLKTKFSIKGEDFLLLWSYEGNRSGIIKVEASYSPKYDITSYSVWHTRSVQSDKSEKVNWKKEGF